MPVIADIMGLSARRVQQIEKAALKKLRCRLAQLGVEAEDVKAIMSQDNTFKLHSPE